MVALSLAVTACLIGLVFWCTNDCCFLPFTLVVWGFAVWFVCCLLGIAVLLSCSLMVVSFDYSLGLGIGGSALRVFLLVMLLGLVVTLVVLWF